MCSPFPKKPKTIYSPKFSDLPSDPLEIISKRLTSIPDYISFRGVCNSWRSAATFANFDSDFPQLPWFMFTRSKDEENLDVKNAKVLNFLDLSKETEFRVLMFNHKESKKYFSSRGWLLVEKSVDVALTHPFWPIWIELPGLGTFPGFNPNSEYFIKKMVLSCSPTIKSDLLVIVIWGLNNQLGFSRPGDTSWTVMDSWGNSFKDMVYHNGKLYALDSIWRVVECDIHGQNPTQIKEVFSLTEFDLVNDSSYMGYLIVESSGKFLIVLRNYLNFQIFKIDLIDRSHIEITDLGNKALFMDSNSSFCVDDSVWNEVRPNCIYLLSEGVYSLMEGNIVAKIFDIETRGMANPLIWVLPSF